MNRLIIAIMGLLLFSTASADSPNLLAGYVNTSVGNASIITVGVNSSYSNAASAQTVYAAEAYLQARLGQSYYKGHVSYYGAESYGNTSYVYFAYSVPYSNGTSAMNVTGIQYHSRHLLGITLFLNGTQVTGYIGPSRPYVIGISRSMAVNISQSNGLESGNAIIEGVFNSSKIVRNSTYSVAWAVLGGNPLKSGIYQGTSQCSICRIRQGTAYLCFLDMYIPIPKITKASIVRGSMYCESGEAAFWPVAPCPVLFCI